MFRPFAGLWKMAVVSASVVIIATGIVGCGSGQVVRSGSGTTTSSGVAVVSPSAADTAAFNAAFAHFEDFPATCPFVQVPGTTDEAVVGSDGTSWAIASFAPSPSCVLPGGLAHVNPSSLLPFAGSSGHPPIGVFEKAPGGQWRVNAEGGSPFPCPAPGGQAPGLGNGSVPKDVLTAWGMKYAMNCANVTYPVPGH